MSPEDVIPRWLSKLLRRQTGDAHFVQEIFSTRDGKQPKETRQRLALDAQVVCRPCNTRWMSNLDNRAKPVLTELITKPRARRTLSARDCETIARWMVLKSIVLDHLGYQQHGQSAVFFKPSQCFAFKATQLPPKNSQVWIGRFAQRTTVDGNVRAAYYSEFKAKHLSNFTAFICTFRFHELALQLQAIRTRLSGTKVPRAVRFSLQPSNGTWPDFAPEIWPTVPAHWYTNLTEETRS
jgi:hypothetical protein